MPSQDLSIQDRIQDQELSVQALSCERGGVSLFEHLSFSIKRGELVQIIGPNGSGKTTLLRILAGLSSSYMGKVDIARPFLYLGHKPGIKQLLSPIENLRWYLSLQQSSDSSYQIADADILNALAQWQLEGYEHQPCYQLSAGQQQRVALARLLLSDTQLWLLDEPFTAIDQSGVAQLETLLLAHVKNGGAVVLTTHHLFRQSEGLRFISLQQAVD